jgi:crotonobetainyl-CoA:carnitine CoA-transferase CaiB-like acyl-CoA transferase
MTAGPLARLRVVELTQVLAGPFFGRLLADLGADVIKVEPAGGDMARAESPSLTPTIR